MVMPALRGSMLTDQGEGQAFALIIHLHCLVDRFFPILHSTVFNVLGDGVMLFDCKVLL